MGTLAGALPTVDDLQLAEALDRTGSLGAAARELQISQPSASQRLARMERRCGVRLFTRTTSGSRPTEAGRELIRQAGHILGHLHGVYPAVRESAQAPLLVIGTFPSLATVLFPTLDTVLGANVLVDQRVEHGEQLLRLVDEGSMHAAVIGSAAQTSLPSRVTHAGIGTDQLVAYRPTGAPAARRGRYPLKDQPVIYATYDRAGPSIAERISELGGRPRRAATVPVAVEMARRSTQLAIIPRTAAIPAARSDDTMTTLPFTMTIELALVTGPEPPPALRGLTARLKSSLRLR